MAPIAKPTPSSGLCLRITGLALRRVSTASSKKDEDAPSRPSIAPKPSVDIKHILRNPDLHKRNCVNRNYESLSNNPDRIGELSKKWAQLNQKARPLREQRKMLQRSWEVPQRSAVDNGKSESKESKMEKLASLKLQLKEIQCEADSVEAEIEKLALELPNLTSPGTPTGERPTVIEYINSHLQPPPPDRVRKSHIEIGTELKLLDFEAAATTTGWGWYFLKNEAALLEQALVQYALSVAMKKGWMVVSPPSIIYSHMATACGFRPRDQNGEQQIYTLKQENDLKPDLCLAGTAEIPIAAMKANKTLDYKRLPLKMVGTSRCYRAEAGSRGTDTKGLYRVHEFTKVEMFAWTLPNTAPGDLPCPVQTVFDEMMSIQTEILQGLNLHCRILEMHTADLGASAARKRDIEAYFPSRHNRDNGWGEVTSASVCTDYQTRRLRTRVRFADPSMPLGYPHTVNGTALAVPRVVMALLENGWDETKEVVTIPEVLRPWMGGIDAIKKEDVS
ncbi:MAG: Serine--tRNA ligase, mitochondrial [Trichoglossum hirsutum]|nr:MAG: Serine--tRNA ligase, mitochondrial [Trichoglossum hirsutum]